jgi:hypothetical protein
MSNLSDRKVRRMAACRTETTRHAVQPAEISLFGRYRLLWRPFPAVFYVRRGTSLARLRQLQRLNGVVFDTLIPLLSVPAGNSGHRIRRRTSPEDTSGRAPASTRAFESQLFQAVPEPRSRALVSYNLIFSFSINFLIISHSLLKRLVGVESLEPAIDLSSTGVVPLSEFGLRDAIFERYCR